MEGHQLVVRGDGPGGEALHLHLPAETELEEELDIVTDKLTALRLGRSDHAERLQDLSNVFVMISTDEGSEGSYLGDPPRSHRPSTGVFCYQF